eukprot:GEMP01099918.1.p1 GENE.GEMP01099918.1~~GEMP01099918.1.p1  ORF type:complete len:158 (+),score=37.10 GEMP01099918.1:209-682(+)
MVPSHLSNEAQHEICLLEAMFPDGRLRMLKEVDGQPRLELIASSSNSDQAVLKMSCALTFTYTKGYPREAPLVECKPVKGMLTADAENLRKCMIDRMPIHLGQAMIFDLLMYAQEYLDKMVESMRAPSLHKEMEVSKRRAHRESRIPKTRLLRFCLS